MSYTIFTYQCGKLNTLGAGIGFSIDQELYANHELSRADISYDIACSNGGVNVSNVIYKLG